MTTTVPSGYNVTNLVDGADYNSGPGTSSAVNFHCGSGLPVAVSWYFTSIASCTVNLTPTAATFPVGSGGTFFATVTPTGGTVDRVNFSSSNTSIATVSPTSDTSPSYTTTATAVDVGSTTVRADVIMGGVLKCSDTSNITTIPRSPWWQVKDADVTAIGNLNSQVPAGQMFGLAPAGGFPGVPAYSSSTNLTNANASTTGWIANSAFNSQRVFDSTYFKNQIPADVVFADGSTLATPAAPQYGYEWYKTTGNLPIDTAINFGSRKVVLLVKNGNLNINKNINLTKGSGFFMAAVSGNIVVDPAVGGCRGNRLQ